MKRRLLMVALALAWTAASSPLQAEEPQKSPKYSEEDIGIFVDGPNVYNNKALQQQLLTLASRLGQISGVDQTSILSHIGAIQGASSSSFSASVQLMGSSLPGTVNTAAQPSGQTVTTAAVPVTNTVTTNPYFPTTVTAAPAGTAPYSTTQTVTTANGANQQTVTTSTNATNQTVTTTPALTPAVPTLPSASGFAAPTGFSVSALSALNEEMQLSYELSSQILLLGGSENADIAPDGQPKRTVTLGFPISIRTPDKYKGYAATIEVTACLKTPFSEPSQPILKTILPREKTYNVAGLTNKQASFGAGGILGNVISIGGALGFGKQTFYLVQDQDTVAFQTTASMRSDKCAGEQADPKKTANSLQFGWSIKPVLGQKSVNAGLRQTYAQIAFAPGPDPSPAIFAHIRVCWSRYNTSTGAIEPPQERDCRLHDRTIPFVFQTAAINDVKVADRGQGVLDLAVYGAFGAGSRIEFGATSFTDGSAGFEILQSGLHLRFPSQTLASGEARIIAPDGTEVPLKTSAATYPVQTGDAEVDPNWASSQRLATFPCPSKDDAPPQTGQPPPKPKSCAHGVWVSSSVPSDAVLTSSTITLIPPGPPGTSQGPFAVANDGGLGGDLAKIQMKIGARACNLASYNPVVRLRTTAATWLNPTQIRLTLSLPWCGSEYTQDFPLYAIAGGQVYGLSDAPFESQSDDTVALVLPASLFTHEFGIHVGHLFLPTTYAADFWVPRLSVPTITSIQTVSADKTTSQVLLTGFNLSTLSPRQTGVTLLGKPTSTSLSLQLTANAAKSLKLLLLNGDDGLLITAALPDDLVKAAGTGSTSKAVTLSKQLGSIPLNSTSAITIKGSNLDQIIAIQYNGVRIAFTLDPKGKFLKIAQPPPGFTSTANVVELEIDTADGTKQNYPLTIASS